ncbi:MAG TPA: PAS domain-containing protein, partial [Enterovirga sp.]
MAELGDTPTSMSIDRSERPGNVGLLLALAAMLVLAFAGLTLVSNEQAQPIILALLALLAMAGVFFVFAIAVGAIRLRGAGARFDLARAIADGAREGLVVVEDSGRIVYANERYLRMSGATKAADLRNVERLFVGGPEVSEAVYRLAQAGREHRTAVEEVRLSPALGGGRDFGWYRLRVRPIPRPGGRMATLWSVVDVTRDRERQENVFQELQHAIDYLDHAPAGFFSIDAAGEIVYMNATLASWLDHDLAKVGSGGLRLADIMPDAVVDVLTSAVGRPGETRTDTLDLDLRRRQGQPLPVRVFHRVVFGPDGTPGPSRTLILNRSPGEDGAGEGQRAAEVRFARFFNSTPLAIATLDGSSRILRSNPSFLRLFGARARGDAGLRMLDFVAPGDKARVEQTLAGVMAGQADPSALDVGLSVEGGRSARLWLSPVSDSDPGTDGERAVLYALDTTEQRLLEQQFAQAQKMQAIGQLAGGVAHDFNNVLQAIIGYSDLLLANHRPTDPSFQDIMQIKQNANRAASLVRQLLAFSRRQTLRPEVMNVGEALSELTLLLKRLLGERVDLELKHGRDIWAVKADVNQFEQVIVNLAVNARDAMPEGGRLLIRTANVPAAS